MLLKLGLTLLIAPLLLLMGVWGVEYSQVSSCIHLGGSFDYHLGECLLEQQGVFIPFAQRYSLLVSASLWAACLGLALTMAALYVRR